MVKFAPPSSRLLVPLCVALATFVTLAAFYLSHRETQKHQQLEETRIASANFAARLQTHVSARFDTVGLLARQFRQHSSVDSFAFQVETDLYHLMFQETQALNWVDPDGVIRFVTPLEGNHAALGLDLRSLPLPRAALEAARETGQLQVTPPLELAQGGQGVAAYIPVQDADAVIGFLNLVFRTTPLVQTALGGDEGAAYAIRVFDGETEVFSSSVRPGKNAPVATRDIQLANRVWQVHVSPSASISTILTQRQNVLALVVGLLLSGVTGFLSRLVIERQLSLRESQNRFQDFAMASSDWFWELDRNLRLLWASDGLARFLDQAPSDILGMDPITLRNPADDHPKWDALTTDLNTRRPFKNFDFYVDVGGETKWLRVSGVPVRDDAGGFCGYRGVATDITEQVFSEEKAREAADLLANSVEDSNELFSLWDSKDRLVLANRKFRDMHSAIPAAITPGTTYSDFVRAAIKQGYIPTETQHEDRFLATRLATRSQPDAPAIEVTRNDGTILNIRDQHIAGGAIVTIAQDVTEQRRYEDALRASQERYALAVQQVSIWDWDLLEDRLYTSPGFAKSLGYSHEEFEEIKRNSLSSLLHPDDLAAYRARQADHINAPGQIFSNEHRFRTRTGAYRWFLARGQAVADGTGRAVRSTGVLTDITERIELEEELHQSRKMDAIGQLTGGVAHDFNNLLTVIMGNAELIGEQSPAPAVAPLVEATIRAASRGAELTQRLLAFSMRQPLRPKRVDLPALLDGLPGLLTPTLGATIDLHLPTNDEAWPAFADPGQIENAVLNLVLNARDAMPDGGKLTIDCFNRHFDAPPDEKELTLEPGDYVVIRVTDTGTGMSQEVIKHACEPFFTTKGVGKGSGLGLSMVMGFAQQSGGQVVISSREGHGTTIDLYLPRAPQSPDTAPQSRPIPSSRPSGRGEHILLIEDDPALRHLTEQMLHKLGYAVTPAEHAQAARRQLARDPGIDLILSDVVLPGGTSGPAFVAEVLEHRPDMKVIYMSGYPASILEKEGHGATNEILLQKPFKISNLAKALQSKLQQDKRAV
ncbi:PAS domain S-box-containing protein [Aliiroseovarius crassostreae]|nr:PAS domain S-box-containing protein [Aliiroseovarius crassostreae]